MNLINYLRNNNFFIFIAILNVILLLGVILLMQYTKNVLNSDVRSNLFEIVKQNREIIANRINLEIKNLLLSSRHIATKLTNSSPDAYEMNKALIATLGQQDPNIFVASREGLSYTGASPTPLNISSRHYFHLALEGIPNISERLINTFSQENELFIISVPIHHKGKIVGTLQKLYPPNELYKLCIPPLFSSAGITYIINNSGNIILSSDDNKIDDEDFLDKLSRNGNNSAVKQ
ncbi:MAG: cache domain-containing protein, partial [Desulfovibrionaceae bacterium]|nr:cache domain-containing protein [Desulfovibrionaceae bacterium]